MDLENLKSQLGFSLIEVLIAVTILGIVSMTMVSMFSAMSNQQSRIEAAQNAVGLTDEIRRSVETPGACQTALATLDQPFDIAKAKLDFPNGNPILVKVNDATTAKAGVELQNYRLKVDSVQLTNAVDITPAGAPIKMYRTSLKVSLGPISSDRPFPVKSVGSILVTMDASNSKIASCQSSGSSGGSLPRCQAVPPVFSGPFFTTNCTGAILPDAPMGWTITTSNGNTTCSCACTAVTLSGDVGWKCSWSDPPTSNNGTDSN